jgi:hypothetical protein
MNATGVDRREQFFGSLQQRQARLLRRIRSARRIARFELSVAMLANYLPAEILDANVQIASASRALLNKVR